MPFVFSTFLRWWYDSGTPEVRMRYADKFVDLRSKIQSCSIYEVHHKSINWKSFQDIGSLALI